MIALAYEKELSETNPTCNDGNGIDQRILGQTRVGWESRGTAEACILTF